MDLRRFAVSAAVMVIALAGCAGGSDSGGQSVSAESRKGEVGKIVPDWTQPLSTGGNLRLASLRGKAVYLNFFASWCPPCNDEAPDINRLQKKYADKGLVVVGVDELENVSKAEGFRKKYGLSYDAIVDQGGVGSQYLVNGLPVHVFIARDGVIRNIHIGQMDTKDIEGAIQGIL